MSAGSQVCPTVLASDLNTYAEQIKRIVGFASRIQVDLMDGVFASPKSVDLKDVWWPPGMITDIHLMYERPMEHLNDLTLLRPHMVIIHAEAEVDHMLMAAELHKEGIEAGISVLPETRISDIENVLNSFDHLLIFSGELGKFGGKADLDLLQKVNEAREHHPDIEIGWDGGINSENAQVLSAGGVQVLNVGGFIQKAENPHVAYDELERLLP
jgi:ribulose-phosphate 3-epimerase